MSDKPPIRVVIEALAGTPEPSIEQIEELYDQANRVLTALIAEGHMRPPKCGDCGAEAGELHIPGCDVARCKICGGQDIGDHYGNCPKDRPSTTWTGRWPGEVEVEEYGFKDLNELAEATRGLHPMKLRWSSDDERWYAPL